MKKTHEEERETTKKKVAEDERNIKLLVHKIRKMQRAQTAVDVERAQYVQEFATISEILVRVRDEFEAELGCESRGKQDNTNY